MSNEIKSIQEALAEVQRNINERTINPTPHKGEDLVGKNKKAPSGPKTIEAKAETPKSTVPPTSTAKSTGSTMKALGGLAALGSEAIGAGAVGGMAAGALGALATGTETGRKLGKDIGSYIQKTKDKYNTPVNYNPDRPTMGNQVVPPPPTEKASSVFDRIRSGSSPASTPATSGKTEAPKPTELPKIDVPAKKTETPKPTSFSQAFSAAREKATAAGHPSTGQFDFEGKKYQTNVAGEKYVPMSQQTKVEYESGGKKKKMSEDTNPLIAAFLKLQDENPSNMFEAAKKAKKDYDKDGKVESPKDEVWGSRFAAAKKAGKMEEATLKDPKDPSVQGSGDVTMSPAKPAAAPVHVKPTNPEKLKNMKDPRDPSVQGSGDVTYKEEVEIEEGRTTGNRSYKGSPDRKRKAVQMALGRKHKDHPDWNERTSPQYSALKLGRQLQKQGVKEETEVTFSQEEIDHINSFFLEASVAPNRPEVATGADSTSDKMSQNDVTGTAESGKKIEEKLTDEAKAKVRTALSDKMKKSSAPARALIKLAKSNPANVKEEVEELDELHGKGKLDTILRGIESKQNELQRKASRANYLMAASQKNDSHKGSDSEKKHYMSKAKELRKEEIELEEGRPKKNPVPETTERDPRKHIQVEAGRAAAGSVVDFHHNDGSKSKITPAMGRRITSHLQGLKPADRQAAVNKMHDSAEGLKV